MNNDFETSFSRYLNDPTVIWHYTNAGLDLNKADDLSVIRRDYRQDRVGDACLKFIAAYDRYRVVRRLTCSREMYRQEPPRAGTVKVKGQGIFRADFDQCDDPSFRPSYCSLYTQEETEKYAQEYEAIVKSLAEYEGVQNSLTQRIPFTDLSFRRPKTAFSRRSRAVRLADGQTLHPSMTPERELDLAFMRVISGAVIAYLHPESFQAHAVKTGAVEELRPDERAQKAARKLYLTLTDQGIPLPITLTRHLRRIAEGQLPKSSAEYKTSLRSRRKAFVREAVLLVRRLFSPGDDKKGNKISALVILPAFDAVDQGDEAAIPTSKTIENWQGELDAESFSNDIDDDDYALAIPLTDSLFGGLYEHRQNRLQKEKSKT